MRRRLRINWPLWGGLIACLTAWVAYVSWPLLFPTQEANSWELPGAEQVRQRGMATLASAWFFVLGASVGSFLNVVAYRLPLGLTIVSQGSRCPRCLQPILFRHNVPILGWLVLRARCRICRLPISPRYVLVEILAGTVFLLLFLSMLASGGRSLPIRPPNRLAGVMWNVLTPQWDLIGLYFFYACLLSVLIVIALLGIDRERIPRRLLCFALGVAFVAVAFFPTLAVVPVAMPSTGGAVSSSWAMAIPGVGVLYGASLGLLLEWVVANRPRAHSGWTLDPAKATAIIGAYVGWQGVTLIMLVTFLLHTIAALFRARRTLWAFWLLMATTIALCLWRTISTLPWLPGAEAGLVVHAYWAGSTLLLAFMSVPFGPSVDKSRAGEGTLVSR